MREFFVPSVFRVCSTSCDNLADYVFFFIVGTFCEALAHTPVVRNFFLTGCVCLSSEMSYIWMPGTTCTILSGMRWCGTKPQHLQSRAFSQEALGCYCNVMFSVLKYKQDLRPRSSSVQTVVWPSDCLKRVQVTLLTFQNVEGGLLK